MATESSHQKGHCKGKIPPHHLWQVEKTRQERDADHVKICNAQRMLPRRITTASKMRHILVQPLSFYVAMRLFFQCRWEEIAFINGRGMIFSLLECPPLQFFGRPCIVSSFSWPECGHRPVFTSSPRAAFSPQNFVMDFPPLIDTLLLLSHRRHPGQGFRHGPHGATLDDLWSGNSIWKTASLTTPGLLVSEA